MATGYTFPIEKEMVCAMTTAQVSTISSQMIAKKINAEEFSKAKKFIEDLKEEKVSIEGKYYTRATKEMLRLLNVLEANAKARNIGTESMKVFVSVSKGPRLYRGKRRRSFGMRIKMTHIQAVLKPFIKKEKKKFENKKKVK